MSYFVAFYCSFTDVLIGKTIKSRFPKWVKLVFSDEDSIPAYPRTESLKSLIVGIF